MSYQLTDMMMLTAAELTPVEWAVLLTLAWRTNVRDGRCYPSQPTLSAHTRYSQRAVQNAIKRLIDRGFLVMTKRPTAKTSAHYRIKVEAIVRANPYFAKQGGTTFHPELAQGGTTFHPDAPAQGGTTFHPGVHDVPPRVAPGATEHVQETRTDEDQKPRGARATFPQVGKKKAKHAHLRENEGTPRFYRNIAFDVLREVREGRCPADNFSQKEEFKRRAAKYRVHYDAELAGLALNRVEGEVKNMKTARGQRQAAAR